MRPSISDEFVEFSQSHVRFHYQINRKTKSKKGKANLDNYSSVKSTVLEPKLPDWEIVEKAYTSRLPKQLKKFIIKSKKVEKSEKTYKGSIKLWRKHRDNTRIHKVYGGIKRFRTFFLRKAVGNYLNFWKNHIRLFG